MAVTTTNLGVITAYGDAVAAGYTGTKAEWQALMASYATVGRQAVDAKNDAVAAKNTAVSKATEATTAANTATTKANEASASAQSIAQSASQIAQNTSDISELKEDLTTLAPKEDMLKAFPTDTASGSVASFADGANVPVKSLIVNIDPVQSGSGDPSPDNVRPISGWSEVNVGVSGKNLFNNTGTTQTINDVTFTVNSDGTISCSGTATATAVFRVYLTNSDLPQNKTLILNGCPSGGSFTSKYGQALCDSLGATLGSKTDDGAGATYSAANLENLAQYQIVVRSGINANGLVFKPMLRLASESDATFEPYQPIQSVNISLGQTVYSGTLDVTKGELVIDMASVDLGTLNWARNNSDGIFYTSPAISNIKSVATNLVGNIKCSQYATVKASGVNDGTDKSISVGYIYISNGVNVRDSAYTDAITFKTAMSGVQLIYELATPITITLTPHEVTALLGNNNIWADCGDSTVEYGADLTLYLQRLTEPDADMVADANITSGSYFMVGNTLYKATANIASGATISPNVNCTRKSLSEALNELNA